MANSEQDKIKKKTWKLFIAALIFALLAGLGTIFYLRFLEHRLKERLTPPLKTMTHVIVAGNDLPAGTVINGATVSSRAVPIEYVNDDIFTTSQFDSIKGAILIKPLKSGKMLAHDYIDLKIPKDFSGTIQEGHRAVTIQVDQINSISGMIKPGNFIDLFTRMIIPKVSDSNPTGSREAIVPVLEDVLVLATDKISARPNEDEFNALNADTRHHAYNTLTLEVTPREAALIGVAKSHGELLTALRNSNDTGGILFSKVTLADLLAHSGKMLESAISKQHNRNLDGIHKNNKGQLLTRDGVVITDPNVHLNKKGLLVTKDGTVLSGRNLMVGADGRIRTQSGKLIDTTKLTPGKNGSLIDKNGNVIDSNGYTTTKGGFLVDKDGNVITPDGHIISGLTVGKDGQVRTRDGRIITADQISVGKDGKVRLKDNLLANMTVDKNGDLRTADGKLVKATDLVTVSADGIVRSKDGKILKGVHVGKNGKLYNADGKVMTAADIIAAKKGFKINKDGTVTDSQGNKFTAKDLVRIAKDGTVRTKDGTVLKGVYVDKEGKLRNKDGSLLTAKDVLTHHEVQLNGTPLVTMTVDKNGNLRTRDGKLVKATDLVTIGTDGIVRSKDGQILKGVHVGKDGKLYNADGKELTAADIIAATKGLKINKDGTVTDSQGNKYTAKDLVQVDKDGTVRTKDGTILQGVYRDKDGKLRNKNGSLLTAKDVLMQNAIAEAKTSPGTILQGVSGKIDSNFSRNIRKGNQKIINAYKPYEVEYIIGGSSNGPAKTFTVQIDDMKSQQVDTK